MYAICIHLLIVGYIRWIWSTSGIFKYYYFRQLTQGKLADTHNKRALPPVFFICVCLYLSGYFLFLICFYGSAWLQILTFWIQVHVVVTLVPSSTQQADTNVSAVGGTRVWRDCEKGVESKTRSCGQMLWQTDIVCPVPSQIALLYDLSEIPLVTGGIVVILVLWPHRPRHHQVVDTHHSHSNVIIVTKITCCR